MKRDFWLNKRNKRVHSSLSIDDSVWTDCGLLTVSGLYIKVPKPEAKIFCKNCARAVFGDTIALQSNLDALT